MEGHPWLKIGYTRSVLDRISGMQVSCPLPLTLLKVYACGDGHRLEQHLHRLLAKDRRRGEWFETTVEAIDAAFATVAGHEGDVTFGLLPQTIARLKERQAQLEEKRQKRQAQLEEKRQLSLKMDLDRYWGSQPSISWRERRAAWFAWGRHLLFRAGLLPIPHKY